VLEQESPRAFPRQAALSPREVLPGRRSILLLGVVALLAGCAGVQEVTGVATQQDIFQLRQDVAAAQQAAQRAEARSAQLNRRSPEQKGESERQVAALTRQVDSLSETMTTLTGRVEDLGVRLDAMGRQLRATGPVLTPSAPAAPRPPAATPTPGAAPGAPPGPVVAVPSRPTTGALQPQDIYQAAYIDFSKGSYSLAIAGFREFLRRYPDHELAGSAQYWIGEAYLSLARGFTDSAQGEKASESLEQAVQEFKKVLANYPRAEKVPTALYKEALALIDLKQPGLAQARLQYLVDNFPRSEEISLARERLAALKTR
jgi:tol-pal system protein YbgF